MQTENIFLLSMAICLQCADQFLMKLALGKALSRKGITQSSLSEAIGKSPGYVSLLVSNKRMPSHDVLIEIANALSVDVAELFEDGGRRPSSNEKQSGALVDTKGFAEGDASIYEVSPADKKAGKAELLFEQLYSSLAPEARQPSIMSVNRAIPSLCLMKGDMLIIDLRPELAVGQTVLVQHYDDDSGTDRTLIREYYPPVLIGRDPDAEPSLLHIDDGHLILANIHAVVRQGSHKG